MVSCATDVHMQLPHTDVTGPSGELAKRIEALLRNKAGGEVGLYLRRLNEKGGGVLAALDANQVFEPASAIKVLLHLHSMLQVQNGGVSLSTRIPWSKESSGGNDPLR